MCYKQSSAPSARSPSRDAVRSVEASGHRHVRAGRRLFGWRLVPVLPGAEEGIFLAGAFEEEDLAARVGETGPRVDAAEAADAFMLDTSCLILRARQTPGSKRERPSLIARPARRPTGRLLESGYQQRPFEPPPSPSSIFISRSRRPVIGPQAGLPSIGTRRERNDVCPRRRRAWCRSGRLRKSRAPARTACPCPACPSIRPRPEVARPYG